jgi:HPt (histidine-containing phosphotransfer) domain-containing protein
MLIDWTRVRDLNDEIGEDAFVEVADLFLQEIGQAIDRLRAPSAPLLEQELHFVKGGALNLGFAALSTLCQAGEREAANGRGARVDLAAIRQCHADSQAEFQAGLARMLGRSAA